MSKGLKFLNLSTFAYTRNASTKPTDGIIAMFRLVFLVACESGYDRSSYSSLHLLSVLTLRA